MEETKPNTSEPKKDSESIEDAVSAALGELFGDDTEDSWGEDSLGLPQGGPANGDGSLSVVAPPGSPPSAVDDPAHIVAKEAIERSGSQVKIDLRGPAKDAPVVEDAPVVKDAPTEKDAAVDSEEAPSVPSVSADDPAVDTQRARLITRTGLGAESVVFLTHEPLFMGSGKGMDITIEHPEVARRHAAVVFEDGNHLIKDLHGSGQTWVNGNAVNSWRLGHGDRVRVGQVEIVYHWEGQPAEGRAASGPTAPVFEAGADEFELRARRRGRMGAIVVSGLMVIGTAALLFSPTVQDAIIGPDEALSPALTSEAQLALTQALDVGTVLLADGRYDGIQRAVDTAHSIPGSPTPQGMWIQTAGVELSVTNEMYWALWSNLASDDSNEGRVALLMIEGRAHLADAERVNLAGRPIAEIKAHVGRAKAAFNTASKLSPRNPDIKKSLTSASRLVGMAEVREDDLEGRLKRDGLDVLLESASSAEAAGDTRLALRLLEAASARAATDLPSQAPAIKERLGALSTSVEARRAPLVLAGDRALVAGRYLEARALWQEVQRLGPQNDEVDARLRDLEPALVEKAQSYLSQAREMERSGQSRDSRILYRRVLEYVPDRTRSIYGDARAELEAQSQSGRGDSERAR